jgi:hypothetical protein
MTRKHYGLIAGIASAVVAARWWRRRRDVVAGGMSAAGHNRGETIFTNHPAVD